MVTTKGTSNVIVNQSAVSTVAFSDGSKVCYNVEILWDQSGEDIGVQYKEVYFPPREQTINEGVDAITVNMNGQWYGSATTIQAFTSGVSI